MSSITAAIPMPSNVYSRGPEVSATIRRFVSGFKCVVTAPTDTSDAFPRGNKGRFTVFVEGVAGDTFVLEAAYDVVMDENGALLPGTKWAPIGQAVIPALPTLPVIKQSSEDVYHSFRIRRVGGVGGFTVNVWYMD